MMRLPGATILVGPRPVQLGTRTVIVNGQPHVVKVYESLQATVEAQEVVADVRRVHASHARRTPRTGGRGNRLK